MTNAVFSFSPTYIHSYIHTFIHTYIHTWHDGILRVAAAVSMDLLRDTISGKAMAKELASGSCISKGEGGATTWR